MNGVLILDRQLAKTNRFIEVIIAKNDNYYLFFRFSAPIDKSQKMDRMIASGKKKRNFPEKGLFFHSDFEIRKDVFYEPDANQAE